VMDIHVGASIKLTERTKHRKRSRNDADKICSDVRAEANRYNLHKKSTRRGNRP
jgi:hypothetical protein